MLSLDFVIISAHQQPGENLEDRYCETMRKLVYFRGIKILAHPINRNLTKGVMTSWNDINWTRIFCEARDCNFSLEINGTPERMDLDWSLVRKAKHIGCSFVLSSDAHSRPGLSNMEIAVLIARKGNLSPNDILNCKELT